MVKIEANWLSRAFLSLRRGSSAEAREAALELRPYTEQPGQRVPVPGPTLLRAGLALQDEARRASVPHRRDSLRQEADVLIGARQRTEPPPRGAAPAG
ncbi:hypothetical protein ACIQV2_18310 [Streptomyces globosus]|uniref:hypothetical protein n=1 Tax=Streptomyces globosus TaxID=68209 RepID=UPI00381DE1A5